MSTRTICLTAFGMLRDAEGRVLLLRRKETGYGDGAYGMPGGKVENGENFIEGVIREVREETGCLVKAEDCEVFFLHHAQNGEIERLDAQFLIKTWQGTPNICEPEKSDKIGWFSLEDLPLITPLTKLVFDAYTSGQRYKITPKST